MKVLTVVTHPREDSFTFAVTEKFVQGLRDAEHEVEVLDLHRIGFDPILWEADEPDWSDSKKIYSPEVQAEMARMKEYDALAYIFPVWWYGIPAMLKGYIDRVWNHGFAYGGGSKLHHKRVLWLALAGASEDHFVKRSYDSMLSRFLNVGISNYSGIEDSHVEFFYDTLEGKSEIMEGLLERSYQLGLHYEDVA
ncbi:NAD(P)H oxidoreductase [Paenibacillus sp. JCM 10914]|uniref:NAD(P)H oxidoreductase n=1 Tax=Paenibacillus sp. JCM 10914 TaxID=1236974 RepID=UPI0003CC72F4|nr:NAD(P)H oxidoreductase [Paenibacillus sp. JCM 10914]GAE05964.1 cytochrome c-type biogenesis protein CcdA [Paenibacillus sp. JCM 10914]